MDLRLEGKVAFVTGASKVASPLASFVNGAHIPVDGAQRKAIMDH